LRTVTAATTPLVGREPELRHLERPLADVDAGAAHAVALWGEPGIGKSRLLGEIGERAVARGHLRLAGRAAELPRCRRPRMPLPSASPTAPSPSRPAAPRTTTSCCGPPGDETGVTRTRGSVCARSSCG
jgi:hypothetical protein